MATPEKSENLMTMDEAIECLNTTRATFYRWLRAGKVKGFKAGRQWRFREEDIQQFLKGKPPKPDLPVSPEPFLARLATLAERKIKPGDDPIRQALDLVFELAWRRRGTDIHVEPVDTDTERVGKIRLRIDGNLQELCQFDYRLMPAVVERLKEISGMDATEIRYPQDGRLQVTFDEHLLDLRVCSVPCHLGESITIRILDQMRVVLTLDDFKLAPHDLKRVRRALKLPHGLLIAAGPTGSGKTTTLYGCVAEINRPEFKVMTIEDPVAYAIPNAIQMSVNREKSLTYPAFIRAALRSDPDVLVVSDIPDTATLHMCIQAAASGHLVLANIHCMDTASVLRRFLDLVEKPLLVVDALRLVTAQRLVRCLCPDCSKPAKPNKGERAFITRTLKEHGLTHDAVGADFRQPVGCKKCGHRGFRRRTVLFEALPMSKAIESAMLDNADHEELRAIGIREGMTTMAMDGLRQAGEGRTSIREVRRVTP